MSTVEKQRMEWLDALKGFGILCVTLGHLNGWLPLEKYIYSFHMFLFFFLSGFVRKRPASLIAFLKKKVKGVLIPFACWSLLSGVLERMMLHETALGVLQKSLMLKGETLWNAPLWFLLTLFLVQTLFEGVLHFAGKNEAVAQAVILPVSLCLWAVLQAGTLPLMLNLVPMGLLFYTAGTMTSTAFRAEKLKPAKISWMTVAVIGLVSVICAESNIRIRYTVAQFGQLGWCFVAAAAGVGFWFLLFCKAKIVSQNRLLVFWGRHTLLIMAAQYWVFMVVKQLSETLIHVDLWHLRSMPKAVLITVFTMALLSAAILLYQKAADRYSWLKKAGALLGV